VINFIFRIFGINKESHKNNEEEMKGMIWLEAKGENSGIMDTYMGTKNN